MANTRLPKTATCIFLIGFGICFLLMPLVGDRVNNMICILCLIELYGVVGIVKNLHSSITPCEANEFANRDTAEKNGEPTYDVKE